MSLPVTLELFWLEYSCLSSFYLNYSQAKRIKDRDLFNPTRVGTKAYLNINTYAPLKISQNRFLVWFFLFWISADYQNLTWLHYMFTAQNILQHIFGSKFKTCTEKKEWWFVFILNQLVRKFECTPNSCEAL